MPAHVTPLIVFSHANSFPAGTYNLMFRSLRARGFAVKAVEKFGHDPRFPVICMDESSKQLISAVRAPIPAAPGHGQIVDHEYVRHGVATLFVEVEPLAGRRHVEVTERRTRQDWAHFIKAMLDEQHFGPLDDIQRRVLWLAVRVERRMGNANGEASYAQQLRKNFPESKEAAALQAGRFE